LAKALVIGAGPAGCASTHFLTNLGHDVTLIERAPVLGGSCRTFYWGGHPYTLGPRHFLTRFEKVWAYFDKYCPMKRYEGHEFLTYIERDQSFYHFPIHRDEVDEMPDADKIRAELAQVPGAQGARNLEEYWLFSVGPTLYDKFVRGYSKKMWQIEQNTEITDFGFTPKGVALKTGPIKAAWSEALSGFPKAKNGYDDYFIASTSAATVKTSTTIEEFDIPHRRVKVAGEWSNWDIIISTLSPEDIFQSCFGPLRWMGRDFFKIVLPVREALPEHIYFLYYANEEPFTRLVEYKKFYEWDKNSPTTLLGIEIPSFRNKLYPFPMAADQALAKKYLDLLPQDVYSIGRMGTYRYLDIGNIVEQCFELQDKIGKAR
jgi:UDP-galactopyranose mutase